MSILYRSGLASFSVAQAHEKEGEPRGLSTATIRRTLPRPNYSSPKFRAIAERVMLTPTCGHIIFCEVDRARLADAKPLVHRRLAVGRDQVLDVADAGRPRRPWPCVGGHALQVDEQRVTLAAQTSSPTSRSRPSHRTGGL